jgi:hypothetical protein
MTEIHPPLADQTTDSSKFVPGCIITCDFEQFNPYDSAHLTFWSLNIDIWDLFVIWDFSSQKVCCFACEKSVCSGRQI